MSIFKTIYIIGSKLRRTPVISCRDELLESQWWTREQVNEYQLAAVNSLISHARDNSPFYRKIFEDHDFPHKISSLKELDKLPVFGKKEMIENLQNIQNPGKGGKLIPTHTSGTSGHALRFFRSGAWDTGHRAAIARGYSWYGVDPWMRNGLFLGIPLPRLERFKARTGDILVNRFRPRKFDFAPDTLEDFYKKLRKASFLGGFPSWIFELALLINKNHPDDDPLPLRFVKGTSEKIYPHYQDAAKKAFGMNIISEYGAAEAGIIAFECPEGRMHVNMEHVIVEVKDGEIVITNLLSHSFPFIRYRLGDYITFDEDHVCPCGRKTPVIMEVSGRVGKLIHGRSGATFPSLIIYYIIKKVTAGRSDIRRLSAIQRKKGELLFQAAVSSGGDTAARSEIENKIRDAVTYYFPDEMACSVEFVSSAREEKGKLNDFVSMVP